MATTVSVGITFWDDSSHESEPSVYGVNFKVQKTSSEFKEELENIEEININNSVGKVIDKLLGPIYSSIPQGIEL